MMLISHVPCDFHYLFTFRKVHQNNRAGTRRRVNVWRAAGKAASPSASPRPQSAARTHSIQYTSRSNRVGVGHRARVSSSRAHPPPAPWVALISHMRAAPALIVPARHVTTPTPRASSVPPLCLRLRCTSGLDIWRVAPQQHTDTPRGRPASVQVTHSAAPQCNGRPTM